MRRKNVKTQVLIGLLILGGLAACKKDGLIDVGAQDELLREVTFRIKPFETKINPLMSRYSANGSLGMTQVSEGNVSPSENEQMLYLWTFNQEFLVPDIGIDMVGAEISALRNNGSSEINDGEGYSFGNIPGGRAISVTGLDEIRFSLPLLYTTELSTIRFDAFSSNTGPKNFSIYYSLDPSVEPILLSDSNLLQATTKFKSFEFDLNGLNIIDNVDLQVIIKAKEGGERPEGSNYNPSSGTFRIDNFALIGIYTGPEIEPLNLGEGMIHYHVFNADDSLLVQMGEKPINSDQMLPELAIKLADGEYFISFTANFSKEPLTYPASVVHAEDLFLYQKLSNKTAVYGALLSGLEISADLTMDLEMERYFSEVNFEFTDDQDLGTVQKIEIECLSKPFFSPYSKVFNSGIELMQQEDKITFYPELNDSNTIRFFQFLGKTSSPKSVSYKLTAFGSGDEILREVVVNALINNNVQLYFKGKLLEGSGNINSGFRVNWKNEWGAPVNIGF